MKCISLKLLIVAVALNIVLLPLSTAAAVLCGYAILVLSAVVPIDLMLRSGNRLNRKQLYILIAFLLVVVCNSAGSIFQLQLGDLENVLKAFVSFFAFLWALSVGDMTYTERDLKFYFLVNRFLAATLIVYTIIPFGFQYTVVGDYGHLQFTLSMGNPNATATKVMFSAMLLVIQNGITKNMWSRWLNVLLIGGLLYTLYKLESRTALACTLLGILMSIVFQYRTTKRMVNLVWLIPAAFIPVQIILEKFPLFKLLGKSLASGREEMFTDFINEITTAPADFILGNFFRYQLANYHNIFFTLLFNVGVVGIVLYLAFWRVESRRITMDKSKIANFAWIAIIVFIGQSMAEAATMSGSFTFGAIIILLNRMTKDTLILTAGAEEYYDLTMKTKLRKK